MFKCWVYISGENNVHVPEKYFSVTELTEKNSKEKLKERVENSSSDTTVYIPGIKRFGFLASL